MENATKAIHFLVAVDIIIIFILISIFVCEADLEILMLSVS